MIAVIKELYGKLGTLNEEEEKLTNRNIPRISVSSAVLLTRILLEQISTGRLAHPICSEALPILATSSLRGNSRDNQSKEKREVDSKAAELW